MDDHGNSSSYDSRSSNYVGQSSNDIYQPKRSSSYRRPNDLPTPAKNDAPGISNNILSNTARAVSTGSVPNGFPRVYSHRRRQSQQIPPPGAPSSVTPPAAPEVPRGPPPTSYRDPYAPKGPRSQVPTRTHSGRSRDPALPMNASRQQRQMEIQTNVGEVAQANPLSPLEPLSATLRGTSRKDATRRPSVPERSPLQTLEGKLDDISKEERRARMEEAEWAAQKRAESERQARRAREIAPPQQRNVSGPLPGPERDNQGPSRSAGARRNVSMPIQNGLGSPLPDSPVVDLSKPWNPAENTNSGSQRHDLRHANEAVGRVPSKKGKEPVAFNKGLSFRDRTEVNRGLDEAGQKAPAKGLGLYGVIEPPHASRPVGGSISRYDSKRFSKDLPPTPRSTNGVEKARDSRGILAAQREMEQQRLAQSQNEKPSAPPPQPVSVTRNHVGFASTVPSPMPTPGAETAPQESQESHQQSVSDLWGHDPDRRYQPRPMLEEWKTAPAAALLAQDLDLDGPEPAEGTANKAWWEEDPAQRRQSNPYPQTGYDGHVDEPTGQTSFNPPLYLKCGPLLRYTGIRRDKRKNREIWRGSIMIVTTDAESSYQKPPTLRLFKQPMDLLPPPPAEVNQENLDPAYVDPIEGQIKMSRTGKTLYVKPIEEITPGADLSRVEDDSGLFQGSRITTDLHAPESAHSRSKRVRKKDGEKVGKVREVPGVRLHAEQGVTFWRFNLEIELGSSQARIAYRINRGPAIGFWVPAKGETMNIMFHSCNGFSLSVDSHDLCGPDPLWRDVLNNHQTRPFHVMIGGGDQIYNDAAMRQTTIFRKWTESKNPLAKHEAPFSEALQEELEKFYLDRYSMWFSQGLFGMANSQIPMVNIWDDHDIIDGYGSYPHHFMSTPVFTGLGAVAFKYYMLFQHQSVISETEKTEPSWILGSKPGPYIKERSRSIFLSLGRQVAFLGVDCRTERRRDEVMTDDSYNNLLDRVEDEVIKGETKHLIVLLGVPIAYPRLNFLENVLTSRVMDPIKALGRYGLLGNFVNKFDGGVEILDDLDDHWTARHHKGERLWFIQQLQNIAAVRSVRVTILGGDVHLAAVGQFYTNKKSPVPKDKDHRYMPNVISSAIVNTPPPELMADILNKRNKVHHLDENTDEDMIPLFTHDVDGKKRNNNTLLPRRNWCSLREYKPGDTPPQTPESSPPPTRGAPALIRTLSDSAPGKMVRRMSMTRRKTEGPPVSYYNTPGYAAAESGEPGPRPTNSRRNSISSLFRRRTSVDAVTDIPGSAHSAPMGGPENRGSFIRSNSTRSTSPSARPNSFHRRPTLISRKTKDLPYINLEGGLDICLNVEISEKDPAGITTPYRLLVPALDYTAPPETEVEPKEHRKSRISSIFGAFSGGKRHTVGDDGYSHSGSEVSDASDGEHTLSEIAAERAQREEEDRKRYRVGPRLIIPSFSRMKSIRSAKNQDNAATGKDSHANPGSTAGSDAAAAAGTTSIADGGSVSVSGPITARDIAQEANSYPNDKRESVIAPAHTSSYSPPMPSAPPLPHSQSYHSSHSRGASLVQHNSSHRSQLPRPVPAYPVLPRANSQSQTQGRSHSQHEHQHHHSQHRTHHQSQHHPHSHPHSHSQPPVDATNPQPHRRSMGGILNQHRDKSFERDAHITAHTPATYSGPMRSGSYSRRESYPPHPAIVGAGPGSPYSRMVSSSRTVSGNGDMPKVVSGGGVTPRAASGITPRAVSGARPASGVQAVSGGDYFSSGGGNRSVSGGGARYLGGGRYADQNTDDEDSDSDDTERGQRRYDDVNRSRTETDGSTLMDEPLEKGKGKRGWKIWKVL
ncbi:hypothetical protein GQ43DRAFT_443633 [Delitschia confertaspora ATCC 74209]|uniref:PhoD-like phosphatase domain-containing protein n=1 Tax=Delitschia confertaspora ATCC 74209 TaxID=1513339 RepID=A0A9P4JKE2_9PLEO|nr:hypothetical protein GQ43DRAFT_443633 [Delitschia confertaspora ATCC 74209]